MIPASAQKPSGSKVLFLGVVTLPPGARTRAHVHERHETALYVVSGEIEIWTGDQLQHREMAGAGDYIYIPANVLHVGVNRGNEPAVCIGTRNEPTAQESLVLYPEMDARCRSNPGTIQSNSRHLWFGSCRMGIQSTSPSPKSP